MEYQCNKCQFLELMLNTRDGVTPFGLNCLMCDGVMYHVNWPRDERLPNFVELLRIQRRIVTPIMRVFVDALPTHQHIQNAAKEHVERWWELEPALGGGSMSERWPTREAAIEFFIGEWTKPGSPTILPISEYLKGLRL